MHDSPRKKTKKQKQPKQQYILWWRPPGKKKMEFGPIYDIKTVKRDTAFYKSLYGEENAGWELYDPARERPRWRY